MKTQLLILGLLLFSYAKSDAQIDTDNHRFMIGITPSALFNGWIGYQAKATYGYRKMEFDLNVGLLKGRVNSEPYQGYRIRPVIKFHFAEIDSGTFYFGLGALYRRLNIDATGTFSRFNDTFFQEIDFKIEQSMKGLYAMFGILIPLRYDRFYFDMGFGFGNSIVNTYHFNVPDDAEFLYNPPLFTRDTRSAGSTRYPITFGHFAMLYKF